MAETKTHGSVLQHDVRSEDTSFWNLPEIQEADSLTLVHNACASFSPMPMQQLSWQDFENNILVAVKGAWFCSQPLIRLMIKKGNGSIVNILTSAIEGSPPKGFAAYVTAKHALKGFTLALAIEYAARGIRVFSVSPGYMETSLTQQWDSRLRRQSAQIQTHHIAERSRITNCCIGRRGSISSPRRELFVVIGGFDDRPELLTCPSSSRRKSSGRFFRGRCATDAGSQPSNFLISVLSLLRPLTPLGAFRL